MKRIYKKIYMCLAIILTFTFILPDIIPSLNTIKVVEAAVKISKNNRTLIIGQSYTLKINGTDKKAKWLSDDNNIVTVNSKGKVTAHNEGVSMVTASINGKKYKCKITVLKPFITPNTVNKAGLNMYVGDKYHLSISNYPMYTTWTSSNPKVATVTPDIFGDITALSVGETIITATLFNHKYTCKVIVKEMSKTLNAEKMAAYGLIMLDELLKDPSSLTINNIYHTKTDENSEKQEVVVIDFTATNSFGGRVRNYASIMISNEIYKLGYTLESDDLGYVFMYILDSKPSSTSAESLNIDDVLKEKINKKQNNYTINYYK